MRIGLATASVPSAIIGLNKNPESQENIRSVYALALLKWARAAR